MTENGAFPVANAGLLFNVEVTRRAPVVVGARQNLGTNTCAAGLGDMGDRVSVLQPTENDETGRPQMDWLHRKDLSSHQDLVKLESQAVLAAIAE
jgi:hypothetical protein